MKIVVFQINIYNVIPPPNIICTRISTNKHVIPIRVHILFEHVYIYWHITHLVSIPVAGVKGKLIKFVLVIYEDCTEFDSL